MCEFSELNRKKTKQFVIQAHLHCMKTHKPTYASHHYISFRELTTNNDNTMTMTINDHGDDDSSSSDYSVQNFLEKCAYKHKHKCSTRSHTFYNQNIVCWLQTKCTNSISHHAYTQYMYIIIIVFRFGPRECTVCSRCNVARPVNLIWYFMRPNVSSYDCLFRIVSLSLSSFIL